MKSRLLLPLPALVMVCVTGYTATVYRTPDITLARVAVGADTSIGQVQATTTRDGARALQLDGYHQDQSAALGKATEGAVRAILRP